MLSRIDLRGRALGTAELRRTLPRGVADIDSVVDTVRPVVDAVRADGTSAALEHGERFDGVRPTSVRVPADVIDDAAKGLAPGVRDALVEAIRRARIVHSAQQRADTVTEVAPGAFVTQRWVPVERVGLYVPGGKAVYPSSVIMNVEIGRASCRESGATTVV